MTYYLLIAAGVVVYLLSSCALFGYIEARQHFYYELRPLIALFWPIAVLGWIVAFFIWYLCILPLMYISHLFYRLFK